jgi:hypothetical protein
LGVPPGVSGILRFRSDAQGINSGDPYAPTTTRENPYLSPFPVSTPLVHGDGPADYKLVGGPDVFGYWSAGNLGVTPNTAYAQSVALTANRPLHALALVRRVNSISSNIPNPQLLFVNITGSGLRDPAVAVNRAVDPQKVAPQRLQVRGYTREFPFADNPAGAQTVNSLPSYHTWVTYLLPGEGTVTARFTPYNVPVNLSLPTTGTGVENLWLLDTGLLSVSLPQTSYPAVLVDRQTNSFPASPFARAGVGTRLNFRIRNAGNPGSLMSSRAGSSISFSNMSGGGEISLPLTIGATTNLGVTPPVTANIATDAGTVNIAASAKVVGPELSAFVTGITGLVVAGQTNEWVFQAQNTPGQQASGAPTALYQMSILGTEITGPDAPYFSLQGSTQGLVPLRFGPPSGGSEVYRTNKIVFTPNANRSYTAALRVVTDVFAEPGATGRVYVINLSTTAVTPAIHITQQPLDAATPPGGTATFNVVAQTEGLASPLSYQWKRNGEPIFGATAASHTTDPLTAPAVFSCVLSAGAVVVESAPAYATLIETNGVYAQAVLADQPLLYYRLEEQGGRIAFDSSGNGYHGASTNIQSQAGPSPALGAAAEFRGVITKGNIAVPALLNPAPANSLFNSLTVEAWVNLKAWNDSPDPVDAGLSGLFCGNGFPAGSFQLTAGNANRFIFSVRDSSSSALQNNYGVTDAVVFATNTWLHLATVYDAGARTFRFYTNGAEAMTVNLTNAPPAFMTNAHLGAWLGFDGQLHRFLEGQLDEVAVYATALSPERIAAHYQAAAVIGIAMQPRDAWVSPGESATFSIEAEAAGTHSPLMYQWKRNGLAVPGATNATYMTAALGPSENGTLFKCELIAGTAVLESAAAVATIVDRNTSYAQAVLADAPLLYYQLEELGAPTAFDSSGNGFHGSYSNVIAAPGVAPWLGSSASFGGAAAQANIAVPAILNPLTSSSYFNELTVEAWVKLNAWNGESGDPDFGLTGLFCGNQWPEGSFQFVAASESYLALGVRDSSGGGLFNDYWVVNPDLIVTNVWMHLATVYDSVAKTFRLYVNGAQAAVFNLDNAPPAYLGPSHLGAWLGFDGLLHRFLDGQLDEVAVYGTALSAERIAAHYDGAVSIQITQQPADAATSPGGTATFSVAAVTPGATVPLRYQWYRDGNAIAEATDATYTASALTEGDSGASFRCTLAVGPFSRESGTAYVTVIATHGAQAQALLADHPLLYYRFEEQNGGTIFDSSGHGYHGTASNVFHQPGAVTWLGSAAAFQGYDNPGSIAVPALINSQTSDSLFNQVTLVTWVKLNNWNFVNLPGDFGRSTLFRTDFPIPGAFGLSARTLNEFSLDLAGSVSGAMIDFYPVDDAAVFVPGVWLHLAAVYDAIGRTFKLYTNGALCETVTLDFAPPALLWESHIGAWRGALPILQSFLDGQVDELALFGTALSGQRIAAQYQSAAAIQITQEPADILAPPGSTAIFTVVAETLGANVPLAYQWKRNGTSILNATNAVYTTSALGFGDSGAQFQCVLTAGPALAGSAVAAVTVVDPNLPYAQAVLADHPLLYYRMEEQAGSTALDSSGHGYHGTLAHVTHTPGPAPWLGSAASFGGAATRGNIAVPSLINPATADSSFNQVTVEAWVKLNSWNEILDGTEFGLSAIFSGDTWPEGSFQFVAAHAARFSFGVRDSSGGGFYNDYSSTDFELFTTNVWLHLATVYDSIAQTFRLYVNGALKEEVSLDVAPAANLSSSHLGAWLGFDQNLYRFLDGQVDEVAVFGAALTPQQIAAQYQAAVAVQITQQPVDAQAPPGGSVSFTVAAIAPGATVPLRYEWRRNGIAVPNATHPTLTISPVADDDYGVNYHCAVSAGPFTVESTVVSLTVLATNTAYAQAVLADHPLLYYRMEEVGGSTVFDSSGHGFHGTRTGVVSQTGPWPAAGEAAEFHGAAARGHIAVPALIHPVSGSSSFEALTVEAWVRLNQWNDDIDEFGLSGIFTGNGWPDGSFQFTAGNANRFRFGVRDSTGGGFANDYEAADPIVFTTNVWLHLATTYDTAGKTFRFYTNGVEARRVDLDDAPPAFMTNSQIGAWLGLDGNLARFFDGQIDEVAVYATALPPARIAAHYQSAFPNLVAVAQEGAQLRFDWVIPGAVLQENTDLANPSGWTDVPGGNVSGVRMTPGSGKRFFRIRKP